ncbi:MAG: PDZ domain-containing protein [Bacteroidetes bacterium]|nr:PDZ domain-containing protein [Bacteroidota bacterium]
MKKLMLMCVALFVFALAGNSQEEMRLMRFPAIHGDQVVFSYAGDLYTVNVAGGVATKLTNDANGFELFARFSPDGKNIAFTGQYDGSTEVMLLPAKGGTPKRLTYTATLGRDDVSDRMGPNNIVMTWKNNEQIVYRSRKQSFNDFKGQLFLASINGGLSEELPLPDGGWCSFSPDGKKMAYNRVFREFRTWKYYKGGMADDIWIHDFTTQQTTNITNNISQDIFPMWKDNVVYFLSDRDRTMNLFAYDLTSGVTTKLTNYTDYDIKYPSLGTNSIIYEYAGCIYNYDLQQHSAKKIPVTIAGDFVGSRTRYIDASKSIATFDVSPDGSRIVFGARGDVYSVPAKTGITRNLTASSGVHDRDVCWSPDGKNIAYISDRTGEDEIFVQDQKGETPAKQVTKNSDTYKYAPVWSPDSKKLMWSDKMGRLNIVDIASGEVSLVTKATAWEIGSYNWSPDSRWVTYTMPSTFSVSRVFVYSLETKENTAVTDTWYDANGASFDPQGKYLYFSSSRDFNPTYSWTEWNHAYTDMNKVFFVTLQKSTPSPFEPENNEVKISEETKAPVADKKKGKTKEDEGQKPALKVNIDFEGIYGRIVQLPVDAGAYWNISPVEGGVYYAFNSRSTKPSLKYFDLKAKKETDLGNYTSFVISADRQKMLLATNGRYAVIDLPKGNIKPEEFAGLSGMKVWVDLKAEWKQIYDESWRQMRDFFYAPNMHGVDWKAMHDKYAVLLPYVNDRNDLNYLIGELIGELSIGHAYVNGGDKPSPERVKTGLLGAKISRDVSGYYKIDKLLKGENWTESVRSPLTEIGIDAAEGDFIIAINGQETKDMQDLYAALVGKSGVQVELTLNKKAEAAGGRKVIVVPTADEAGLYYYNWVQQNIEKVSKATNGQVGYIHIPDMGPEGLNEFVKYYYPQLDKKALIIDDRGNGGGNVSPMIIERLSRELALYGMSRNNGVNAKPQGMMLGPKVLLLDKYSASDGDLFPYQFKKRGLGKTIGMRSWGGVVGIRGSLPFIDGGDLRRPEFAPFDENGNWAIEGHGVDPDIVIDNDPAREYNGIDEQLNKAIEVILEEMKNYPELPTIPPYPDKTK